MPGLVKIGHTTDLKQRMRDLGAPSGVPLAFECHYAAEVPEHVKVEGLLHQLFSDHRVNPRREFFRISPEKAVTALKIGSFKDVTPGEGEEVVAETAVEKEAVEKERARRGKIRLSAIGICPGAELTFSRDAERKVVVVSDNEVLMNGVTLSLSRAAIQSLQEMGYTTTHASGSVYWLFEGESLDDRRLRLEESTFGGE